MSLLTIKMESKDIFAFEAVGKVCKSDYTDILFPIFDQARKKGQKIRLLIHLGDKFESYTKETLWEDLKLGVKFLRVIDRCAIVSDTSWISNLSSIMGSLIPCSVEVFDNKYLCSAKAWIESGELALDYTLDEKEGVLQVNISAPLSSLNFEVMTSAVDNYIERKGTLNGLLIHTKSFPGWEDVGSFIGHIEFIKSHHHKIKRVAFVTDSKTAKITQSLVHHFIHADIQNFAYDEFDEARKWVSNK